MSRTILAAAFALLAVTAPANASTITTEDISLNFGSGYTASGTITFSLELIGPGPSVYIPDPTLSLFLNGTPVPSLFVDPGLGNPIKFDPVFFDACGVLPCPYGGPLPEEISWPVSYLPTNFNQFIFTTSPYASANFVNGDPAISGSICIVGGACNTSPSAAPLPAALPLFASGIAGLGFIGWRKRRKISAVRS